MPNHPDNDGAASSSVDESRNTKALGELETDGPDQVRGLRSYRDLLAAACVDIPDDFHLNFQLAGVCERLAAIARRSDDINGEERELRIAKSCYQCLLGLPHAPLNKQYGLRLRSVEVQARLAEIDDRRRVPDAEGRWADIEELYEKLANERRTPCEPPMIVPPAINANAATAAEETGLLEARVRGGRLSSIEDVAAGLQRIAAVVGHERHSADMPAAEDQWTAQSLDADALRGLRSALEAGSLPAAPKAEAGEENEQEMRWVAWMDPGSDFRTPVVEGDGGAAGAEVLSIIDHLLGTASMQDREDGGATAAGEVSRTMDVSPWGSPRPEGSAIVEAVAIGDDIAVIGLANGDLELLRSKAGRVGALSVAPRVADSADQPGDGGPVLAASVEDSAGESQAAAGPETPPNAAIVGLAVSGDVIGAVTDDGYGWFGTGSAGLGCYTNMATSVASVGTMPGAVAFGRRDGTLLVLRLAPAESPPPTVPGGVASTMHVLQSTAPARRFGIIALAATPGGIVAGTSEGLLVWFEVELADDGSVVEGSLRESVVANTAYGPAPGPGIHVAACGNLVASAGTGSEVTLWQQGEMKQRIPIAERVEALALHDGTLVVAVADEVRVFDTMGALATTIPNANKPVGVARDAIVAAARADRALWVWDRLPPQPRSGPWMGVDVVDGLVTWPSDETSRTSEDAPGPP